MNETHELLRTMPEIPPVDLTSDVAQLALHLRLDSLTAAAWLGIEVPNLRDCRYCRCPFLWRNGMHSDVCSKCRHWRDWRARLARQLRAERHAAARAQRQQTAA